MKKKQDGRWQDYLPKSRNGSDARKRKRRRRIIVLFVVLLLIGVLAGSVDSDCSKRRHPRSSSA
ncbi:MAG: hypothetical protein J5795_01075 [Lachnospiraceae bacterium]|nr:hypothetical protein [Lachnospiraceae bacterium]